MEAVEAQGIFDIFKLLDKDLIDKITNIMKSVKVETDGNITRITVELVRQ